MLDARFKPLLKWNRQPALEYRRAPFKTAYNKTLDKLEYELRKLDATDIVVEAGYSREQIRNDGWPRGGTRPSHAGVVLYFKSVDGPLCFPCGTYASMEDNIHAIALTLENLRAIDRYGVTLQHQQYLGFAALPAPATHGTVEQAAALLGEIANVPARDVLHSREAYRGAYRAAAARLHPDTGGDRNAWEALQNASVLLEEHHAHAKAGAA